jgi:cytochrome c peroxidase
MKRAIGLGASFAAITAVLIAGGTRAQSPPTSYNPFPSGILAPNLDSELTRVQGEVTNIFGRYLAEWQALSPTPHNAGNPPILVPNGYEVQRILGGLLKYDLNISPFRNRACASCHMPYTAGSDH